MFIILQHFSRFVVNYVVGKCDKKMQLEILNKFLLTVFVMQQLTHNGNCKLPLFALADASAIQINDMS
jgi:flagellar biosynthesis regulator FlbT